MNPELLKGVNHKASLWKCAKVLYGEIFSKIGFNYVNLSTNPFDDMVYMPVDKGIKDGIDKAIEKYEAQA